MKGKILPSLSFSVLFSACILCHTLAFGTVFHADDALKPPEKPQTSFTLESYLNAYLIKSPQVKSERNSLENALANYKNAFINAFLPSFSLSSGANKTYSRYNKPGDLDEMLHFNSSGQASGIWNILNSGKDLLSYKSASLEYESSKIDFDSFIQETVLSAVQKYYTLLLNKKLIDVYRSDFHIAKKQYEQDKKLYDNGLKTRSDLLSSETNYLSSQLSLFSAQNNYSNALSAFNLPLNQSGETEVKLNDKTDQADIKIPTLDKDLAKALEHRHDARKRRLMLQQQEIQLKLGKRNTLPSVFVNLSADFGRRFDHHESWDYNYGASAGISFDLGFFYTNKKNIRHNLERNYENAKLSHEQFLRDMRDDVVQKRNTLELKTQSLKISELRMKAATQKFEATQLKYKNGLMSATDLTVARQEMISAQVNHATLITELALAKLKYRYAIGENIFDFSSEDMQ
ncbi:MAG: TolC family protein [Elusimicrobiales bacterium]|nr:TolC family protein [Elusimicrobiales bacterium]